MKIKLVILLACLWMPLLLWSCQRDASGVHRIDLTGTVTWKGSPLESGKLRLVPEKGSDGQVSGADISSGQYTIKNKGGVLPGTYRVEVTATRVVPGAKLPDGVEGAVYEQYLPPKYNTQSSMTLTIPEEATSLEHDIVLSE